MLQIIAVLSLLLVVYTFLGKIVCRVQQFDCNPTLYPVIGYILCMVIFQILAIPLMVLNASPMYTLCSYLSILSFITILLSVYQQKSKKIHVHLDKIEIWGLTIIILLQWGLLFGNMVYGSGTDNGQYIGEITTALFTNTFKRFDPYTGKRLKTFLWQSCLLTYEAHSTVICKLFDIHPLIFIHRIQANLEITFVNTIFYNILLVLLEGKKRKAIAALSGTLLINFFAYSLYSWSGFMFLRTGESKSMLAVVIVPLLIYWFLKIAEVGPVKYLWRMLFFTILMGLGISKSGAFVIPVVVLLHLIPVVVKNRRRDVVLWSCGCLMPCVVYLILQK